MLSIQQCRELIPDSDKLTDEEVEVIRKDHYRMIELIWDVWFEEKKRESSKKN